MMRLPFSRVSAASRLQTTSTGARRRGQADSKKRRRHRLVLESLEARVVPTANFWDGYAGNPQHTALSTVAADPLNAIHWSVDIDPTGPNNAIHYASPMITPANTVIVPIRTGSNPSQQPTTDTFGVNAYSGSTGTLLWSQSTDYILPHYGWTPSFPAGLTPAGTASMQGRVYLAGAGGTVYYTDTPDSATPTFTRIAFYGIGNYTGGNIALYNSTVFIDTPITPDGAGNVYFGFQVTGSNPSGLVSGIARIDASGVGTWTSAGAALGGDLNPNLIVQHNSAPVLSNDGSTLYVGVTQSTNDSYSWLTALDSTTLAAKQVSPGVYQKVRLMDPRNHNANPARIVEESSATPMVAPDGSVFFGVFASSYDGSRGWMLHFSGDLQTEDTPGAFGWDDTASIVPASMVPGYSGGSSYLILTKYNNYASAETGPSGGDGVNLVAVLDPFAMQTDTRNDGSPAIQVMKEVMIVPGPSPDAGNISGGNLNAVREWCINTAAVDPFTKSIIVNSEDGVVYRWDMTTNTLSQAMRLTGGVGEAYTPTEIGPDGTVYAINDHILFAVGKIQPSLVLQTPSVAISSSATPNSLFNNSVTFTASVTGAGPTPTGLVNFYLDESATPIFTTSLDGSGNASYTTSTLSAGRHFVKATYLGDTTYQGGSLQLVQAVLQTSTASVTSSLNPSNYGNSVTFTATIGPGGSTSKVPEGFVTFLDGATPLGTVALPDNNGTISTTTVQASLTVSNLPAGTHSITVQYSGDTNFTGITSPGINQTVQSSTTTSVTSTANPSVFGQSVTLTATVTSNSPSIVTPTGTVDFMDGTTDLTPGGVMLDVNGQASFTTSAFAVASHAITVTYSGDSVFSSSSGNITQVVNPADTSTALVSSLNPSTYGNSVKFTATVTAVMPSGATVNTGSVSFLDNGNPLATVPVSATGVATFTTTALTAGSHTITANYSDGTNFNNSTNSLTQTVNLRPLLISANFQTKPEGSTLTFAGTEFTLAGAVNTLALVNGNTVTSVTLTSAGAGAAAEDGSYTIVPSNAVGTGLSNYAITYVPGTLTVLEPAITVTASSLATINEGDASTNVEVATFTHANGVEDPGHFTATVNWGVAGHTADVGTITLDMSTGIYQVMAARPVFAEEGSFNLSVSVSDNDTAPNIGQNFAGINLNDEFRLAAGAFIPPDQGSAVGPNHYVEMINLTYAIYNKDGTTAVPPTPLSTFFANAGLPGLGTNLSDPRIVYDPASARWFIVMITTESNSNSFVVAVSQSSDPTGAWKAARFVANNTASNFADYPTIAIDANALYMASNNFANGTSFDGVSLTSIPKSDLLNPAGPVVANRSHFDNLTGGGSPGTQPFTFAPVSDFESRDHGVIVAVDRFSPATIVHLYDVLNPGSNAATLSGDNPLTVPQYWSNQNAHQPDGSRTLESGGDRIGSNNVYQVGNILWAADSILTSATTGNGVYDAIRWYEIDESTNTVLQSGTISDPHHDYIYPSIAANAAGDVVIGFTASGDSTTTDFASSWYVTGTTSGGVTTFGAPIALRNGSSNYSIVGSGRNRWGDFSAISVDPTNSNAFWIAEEVAIPGNPTITSRPVVWGTQISEIVFGNSASAPNSITVNEPAINASSASLPPVVVGQPSATVEVATFTHASGVEPATDFTATIDWGIAGHNGDPGMVTQDMSGTYHVSGMRPVYGTAASYMVNVSISEDNGSTSASDTQVVNPADTSTALVSSLNPSTYGSSVKFTATVTAVMPSGATVNTGSVSFLDNGNPLATVPVSATGVATFTTTALTAGSHTITANYSDGTNFNNSTNSLTQTVALRPLFVTANSTSKAEGNTLTFAGTEFTLAGVAGSRTPVLFNGDTLTSVTLTSAGAAATAEDGSYAIAISNAVGTGLSNYAITYVPGTLTVLEPAITVTASSLATINEGDASTNVEVATFTHANGVEDPGHFTATVNWGVAGHTADVGTITLDMSTHIYHVMAARPVFAEDGTFNLSVSVSDNDTAPNIGQNFAGMTAADDVAAFGGFFIPPDQGSAVGPNHYVEMINLVYAIYNKDGTTAVPSTALSTFYANAGVPGLGLNISDPRILYDAASGRWFAVIVTTESNSNSIVVAVSQTSDPTGSWKATRFVANTIANNFADYPTIAIDANALYIASNNFLNLATFDGISLTTIPKADLLNPAGPVVTNRTHFENIVGGASPGTQPFTFAPVSDFESRDHGVIVAVDRFSPATIVHLYDVLNPSSNPSILSGDNPLTVPQYWTNQLVHEPDGSRTLDGGGDRIGSNNVYQVGNILWAADSILTSATTGNGVYDAVRWYEIDESTNTVLQSGTISDPHHDFIYPSIAANAAGDVVIGFTASGDSTTSDYPGSWYVAGTTSGGVTTFGAPTALRNGSSNYSIVGGGRNRWGDFSAISVDPSNSNAFWIAEETAVPGNPAFSTRTQLWGTQISEIVFGNSASAPNSITVNEPAINASSATLPPVLANQASATVEVATFTHANGVEPFGDFTATINWGIAGHTADPGTVTQDMSGTYHVSGMRPVYGTAGTYTVTVSISEDNVSTSVSDTQFVGRITTSTTLVSSANPSSYGNSVTFTATVSAVAPGTGTPIGTVDFFDTTTNVDLGMVTLSGGQAFVTTATLAVGSHTITASYGGSTNFFPSSTSMSESILSSILVLNTTLSGALNVGGTSTLTVGGTVTVDSSSSTALVATGSAHVMAGSIRIVGGFSAGGGVGLSPPPVTGVSPLADPLASLPVPPGGSAMPAINRNSGTVTMGPGIYPSITLSGNAHLILMPGVYVIAGGGISVSNSASITVASGSNPVTGHGVLIYNAGTNYPNPGGNFGGISLSGGGTITLTPPDQGTYAGIVIFQSRDNNRAISLTNSSVLSGQHSVIYAKTALVTVSGSGQLQDTLVVDRLQLAGGATSSVSVDTGTVTASGLAGELLGSDLYVYVSDQTHYLSKQALARVDDAITGLDALLVPYGVTITEVSSPKWATVTIDTATTTSAGGFADGVLGSFTSDSAIGTAEITLVRGWNWYTGANPNGVGAGQYDFQTIVTHELGHALGLGHMPSITSVMHATLSAGVSHRTMTVADLNIGDKDGRPEALHAELTPSGTPAEVTVAAASATPTTAEQLPSPSVAGMSPAVVSLPNEAPRVASTAIPSTVFFAGQGTVATSSLIATAAQASGMGSADGLLDSGPAFGHDDDYGDWMDQVHAVDQAPAAAISVEALDSCFDDSFVDDTWVMPPKGQGDPSDVFADFSSFEARPVLAAAALASLVTGQSAAQLRRREEKKQPRLRQ
jgi:hypothetical protein